jgi:tetratricopeptide (TPR) repeat protein
MNIRAPNNEFVLRLINAAPVRPCYGLSPLEHYLWNFRRFDYDYPVKAHRIEQYLAHLSFVEAEESGNRSSKEPVELRDRTIKRSTALYDQAVFHYRKALSSDPNCNLCWFNLGTCYLRLQRFIDGVVCLKSSLAMRNSDPALLNLGIAYGWILLKRYQCSRVWLSAANSRFRLIEDPSVKSVAEFHGKYFELLDLYYNRYNEALDHAEDFFKLRDGVTELLPPKKAQDFVESIDTSELYRHARDQWKRRMGVKPRILGNKRR